MLKTEHMQTSNYTPRVDKAIKQKPGPSSKHSKPQYLDVALAQGSSNDQFSNTNKQKNSKADKHRLTQVTKENNGLKNSKVNVLTGKQVSGPGSKTERFPDNKLSKTTKQSHNTDRADGIISFKDRAKFENDRNQKLYEQLDQMLTGRKSIKKAISEPVLSKAPELPVKIKRNENVALITRESLFPAVSKEVKDKYTSGNVPHNSVVKARTGLGAENAILQNREVLAKARLDNVDKIDPNFLTNNGKPRPSPRAYGPIYPEAGTVPPLTVNLSTQQPQRVSVGIPINSGETTSRRHIVADVPVFLPHFAGGNQPVRPLVDPNAKTVHVDKVFENTIPAKPQQHLPEKRPPKHAPEAFVGPLPGFDAVVSQTRDDGPILNTYRSHANPISERLYREKAEKEKEVLGKEHLKYFDEDPYESADGGRKEPVTQLSDPGPIWKPKDYDLRLETGRVSTEGYQAQREREARLAKEARIVQKANAKPGGTIKRYDNQYQLDFYAQRTRSEIRLQNKEMEREDSWIKKQLEKPMKSPVDADFNKGYGNGGGDTYRASHGGYSDRRNDGEGTYRVPDLRRPPVPQEENRYGDRYRGDKVDDSRNAGRERGHYGDPREGSYQEKKYTERERYNNDRRNAQPERNQREKEVLPFDSQFERDRRNQKREEARERLSRENSGKIEHRQPDAQRRYPPDRRDDRRDDRRRPEPEGGHRDSYPRNQGQSDPRPPVRDVHNERQRHTEQDRRGRPDEENVRREYVLRRDQRQDSDKTDSRSNSYQRDNDSKRPGHELSYKDKRDNQYVEKRDVDRGPNRYGSNETEHSGPYRRDRDNIDKRDKDVDRGLNRYGSIESEHSGPYRRDIDNKDKRNKDVDRGHIDGRRDRDSYRNGKESDTNSRYDSNERKEKLQSDKRDRNQEERRQEDQKQGSHLWDDKSRSSSGSKPAEPKVQYVLKKNKSSELKPSRNSEKSEGLPRNTPPDSTELEREKSVRSSQLSFESNHRLKHEPSDQSQHRTEPREHANADTAKAVPTYETSRPSDKKSDDMDAYFDGPERVDSPSNAIPFYSDSLNTGYNKQIKDFRNGELMTPVKEMSVKMSEDDDRESNATRRDRDGKVDPYERSDRIKFLSTTENKHDLKEDRRSPWKNDEPTPRTRSPSLKEDPPSRLMRIESQEKDLEKQDSKGQDSVEQLKERIREKTLEKLEEQEMAREREKTMDSQGPTVNTDRQNVAEEEEDLDDLDLDNIDTEMDGNELYVCYLVTDDGDKIGPFKLDINDMKIGLPNPEKLEKLMQEEEEKEAEKSEENDDEGNCTFAIKYTSMSFLIKKYRQVYCLLCYTLNKNFFLGFFDPIILMFVLLMTTCQVLSLLSSKLTFLVFYGQNFTFLLPILTHQMYENTGFFTSPLCIAYDLKHSSAFQKGEGVSPSLLV